MPKKQTYWILRRDQILCLTSPRRQDILDRLSTSGPAPVRAFAREIGLAPSAAYHHVRKLVEAGLLREAGTRTVAGRAERLYAAAAPRMRLARALDDPASRSDLARVVAAMCRQMSRDFASGIRRPEAKSRGRGRNLGFYRLVAAPSPSTLARLNRYLDAIAELLWKPGRPEAPLLAFGWTLAPAGKRALKRTRKPARRKKPKQRILVTR
ncbi:MAG: ArsR/SmtB family transcription factor [Candidatus Eiseniibacteriota bacterium]